MREGSGTAGWGSEAVCMQISSPIRRLRSFMKKSTPQRAVWMSREHVCTSWIAPRGGAVSTQHTRKHPLSYGALQGPASDTLLSACLRVCLLVSVIHPNKYCFRTSTVSYVGPVMTNPWVYGRTCTCEQLQFSHDWIHPISCLLYTSPSPRD